MATEDILIRYRADVGSLESDLNKLIKSQEELTDATKQQTAEQSKAATTIEAATKKRAQLLEQEIQKLEKLKKAQQLAFNPDDISKFNSEISQTQENIDLLSNTSEESANSITTAFTDVGAALVAAFSVDAITSFASASFTAFMEAEDSANSLKFAIVNLGGEGEDAFQRLIDQSSELQKTTVFGDDQIQQAQAALSTYGLTAAEIEKLTPLLLDFADASNKDLGSAVSLVTAGLEGQGKEFKKLQINVDAAASRQENFNSILQGFSQFAGSAANSANTLSGEFKKSQNEAGDLQEEIGAKVAPAFIILQKATVAVIDIVNEFINIGQKLSSVFKVLTPLLVVYTGTLFKTAQATAVAALQTAYKSTIDAKNLIQTKLLTTAETLRTAATVQGSIATKAAAVSSTIFTAATNAATAATTALNVALRANPFGLILGVLSAVVIAYQAFADSAEEASQAQEAQAEATKELNAISAEYTKKIVLEERELDKLYKSIINAKNGTKERKDLLDEFNSKYGTTLQNIQDEKLFLDQLKTAYDNILPAIRAKFTAQASEARVVKSLENEIDATLNLNNATKEYEKGVKALRKQYGGLIVDSANLEDQTKEINRRGFGSTQAFNEAVALREKYNLIELQQIKSQASARVRQEEEAFVTFKAQADAANASLNKGNEEAEAERLKAQQKANEERNRNAKAAADEAAKIEAERQKAIQDAFNKATDEFLQLRSNAEKALADLKFELNTDGLAPAIQEFQQQASVDLKASIDQLNSQIAANPLAFEGLTNEQKLALLTQRFTSFVNEIDGKWKEGGVEIADTSENIAASLGPEFLALPFEEAVKLLPELAGKYLPQFKNSFKNTADEVVTEADKIAEANKKASEAYAETWISSNKEILEDFQKLANELIGLFKTISDKRIEELNKQTQAQLEFLEEQDEINKQEFENRAVSEREYLAEQTRIENERIRIQEEAAEKEKALKRQQFIAEQAAAIFEIGITTAEALAKINASIASFSAAGLIPLAANAKLQKILLLAQSVAQVAAVLAQPKPYRKGSKDTGPIGHMARVGEEGEEIVFMPGGSKVLPARQTNRYGEVLDAMFDNKLDNYILKKYVTPALMAQKKNYESQKGQSFADNLAKSIYFNGLNANDMERIRRKGQPITNVDELADAIARKIPSRDIYR